MVLSVLDVIPKKTVWPQYVGAIGATLAMVVIGLMGGWSSPYIAQLTAKDSPLPITTAEASWVASILHIGRIVGSIVGAFSTEHFGSKSTLLFTGIPATLSWILFIFASSVEWLYAARFLSGCGFGLCFSSFPLYIGEISDPGIRGSLVTMATNGNPVGVLLGSLMGAYLSMRLFACISLVPTLAFVLIFLWLPDSPHSLVRKDKTEEAKRSMLWYHREANTKLDVETLKQFASKASSGSLKDILMEFNIPRNRKAGILIILLYFFMQFGGLNTVVFYMETILIKVQVTVIDPADMVIIAGVLSVAAGWFAMFLIDSCGRRILLAGSSAGVGLSMVGLAVSFMMLDQNAGPSGSQWLPITSLVVFNITVCLGICMVPSVILSELFAPNIKSLAASGIGVASGVFGFAASKSYQPLVDLMGEQNVFWLHAVIMLLCVLFAFFCLPETKGKTLEEIQDLLARK